ncbi:MAG: exopolyphosphatase [Bacteroidetes bacterium RIFCSPLOWO2_12_FULL_35_15]|nr:MAG: exopolyphosphatase [Bacteroidetes bacterium RIFCSPLOWO2_12_FULL_35_15]
MKFAAIDIGSNAVRLLFCNVYDDNGMVVFKKAELIRVPIRLGEDSFLTGKISREKTEKLVTAMKAFKNLISVYDAVDYRACATSAMRDAENRWDVIEQVRKEAGIKIEIIDGKTEADIIYSNHIEEHLDKSNNYLYIDIGGGSTEITLFSKNKAVVSQSFNIGTIRMLHDQIDKEYWTYFKNWIQEITKGYKPLIAIGSGGNINKLFKMSGRKLNKALPTSKLKNLYELLESYTYEERVKILGLNPDRADVIITASKIVLTVLKKADIEKIIVPQIGLADGIVHQLYEKYKSRKLIQQ